MHRHGSYERYANPKDHTKETVQRFLCPPCGLTFSVLLRHRLPYRPIPAERLQGDFDQRAGIQTQGLDPPPGALEAGCLQRAWQAFSDRVATLKAAFGPLVASTVSDAASLWRSVRQALDSVPRMLCFLSQHHHISLLGTYRGLHPPA